MSCTGQKFGGGPCFNHWKLRESVVQLWKQSTLVNDYRCPPGGMATPDGCGGAGAQPCTPDPDYKAGGIPPYPRHSDGGNDPTNCPQYANCDTPWPCQSYMGNCPCTCGSDCNNLPGLPGCNSWADGSRSCGKVPPESPKGLKMQIVIPEDYYGVESNTFLRQRNPDGSFKTVDLSVCHKLGGKWVQAWLMWYGRFNYRSHDGGNRLDLSRALGSGVFDGTTSNYPCGQNDIEFEQGSPDLTKYLTEQVWFDASDPFHYYIVVGGDTDFTVQMTRTAGVGKNTGVQSISGSESLSGSAPDTAAALSVAREYLASMNKAAAYGRFTGWVFSHAPAQGYTFTVTNTGSLTRVDWAGGQGYATFDAASGHMEIHWAEGALSLTDIIDFPDDTHFTRTFHDYDDYCGAGGTVTFTLHGTLSSPYTATGDESNDVVTAWRALFGAWNLADDLTYPYRMDGLVSIGPVVHLNQVQAWIMPDVSLNPYVDFPTNTVPWVDGAAACCDGSLQGGPLAYPGVDTGFFDWNHITWRFCCAQNEDGDNRGQPYVYARGAFAGSGGIPKCATRWTENWSNWGGGNPPTPYFDCGGDYNAGTGGIPPRPNMGQGPDGPGTQPTSLPYQLAPFNLPPGMWAIHAPGTGMLYGQKWCEIKLPRPAINFARPFGADRYAMMQETVRCIQSVSGAGPYTVIINSATAINSGDKVYACGGGVPGGAYTATKLSATSYGLAAIATAPGYSYAACGTGIVGKLRWPAARAIGGRLKVRKAVQSSPGVVTVTVGNGAFLATGDAVDFTDVPGLGANLVVTVVDAKTFTVSGTLTGTYSGGGFVASHGAPDSSWNSALSNGDFLAATWVRNMRDWQERYRVIAQYAACGCADAAPASSTPIRANQALHGMPQDIAAFGVTKYCLPFTSCDPQVIALSCSGYNKTTNPNGEQFSNGVVIDFPSFTPDERYGAMVQMAVVQCVTDPFYETPAQPCESVPDGEGGSQNDFTPCSWDPDDGSCVGDSCAPDPVSGLLTGQRLYAYPPQVEPQIGAPAGAPTLPSDVFIGFLGLAALDTAGSVNGNVLPPPTGAGFDAGGNDPSPHESVMPWMTWRWECFCVANGGRFAAQYQANGVRCTAHTFDHPSVPVPVTPATSRADTDKTRADTDVTPPDI